MKFYSVCRPLSEFPDLDLHLVSNIRQPSYDKVLSLSLAQDMTRVQLLQDQVNDVIYDPRPFKRNPRADVPVDEIARRFLSNEISVF